MVTYPEKVRCLLQLAKGLSVDGSDAPADVYGDVPIDDWHVSFDQMVYVGDGASDLPAFDLIGSRSGIGIVGFDPDASASGWSRDHEVHRGRRVHNLAQANGREGAELLRSLCLASSTSPNALRCNGSAVASERGDTPPSRPGVESRSDASRRMPASRADRCMRGARGGCVDPAPPGRSVRVPMRGVIQNDRHGVPMPTPDRHPIQRLVRPLLAAAFGLVLSGCAAMGELARHGPWAWVGVTVAVLAVVGFIVSRMRR